MSDLLPGGRAILLDLASTLVFLAVFALTGSLLLATGLGVALAILQIGWRLLRRETVDALQWISLITVVAGSAATWATHDARFVMLKPTAIYALIGMAMLRKGWMHRYMPRRALDSMPDVVVASGYVWAGLMAFSAMLNILLAMTCSVVLWGTLMSLWGIASKTMLFFGQYAVMKFIGKRRAQERVRLA